MCRVLGVSRSGYYKWKAHKPAQRRSADTVSLRAIRTVHEESKGRYGSPRVHGELRERGISCGRGRVARLMRQGHLRGMAARRRKPRMPSVDRTPLPNRLQRQFLPGELNRFWTADITYIRTAEGWLFLAVVLDVGSRRIVGWAMSRRPDTDLTISALEMAVLQRQPKPGLIHHCDRGVHYTNSRYRKYLADHGILESYSGLGNCWDNAVTKSIFHTLKTEEAHVAHYKSRKEARLRLFEFIEIWYNRKRRHTALGQLSPTEFEH